MVVLYVSRFHVVYESIPRYITIEKHDGRSKEVERVSVPLSFKEAKHEVDCYLSQMFNEK